MAVIMLREFASAGYHLAMRRAEDHGARRAPGHHEPHEGGGTVGRIQRINGATAMRARETRLVVTAGVTVANGPTHISCQRN